MTKRRVERDLDELSKEMLSDLDPEVRLQLWVEAAATGKKDWIDQLSETAPVHMYRATDLAYVERGRAVLNFLSHAIYNLHTTALHHELLDRHQKFRWLIDRYDDTEPTEEELKKMREQAEQIKSLFIELYTAYNAYQEFATEVIGVDIETWFTLHPDGPGVLEIVEQLLDDEMRQDLAEEFLNDSLHKEEGKDEDVTEEKAPDSEPITLDELTEYRYQNLAEVWENMIKQAI